jgi:hypothetical protein
MKQKEQTNIFFFLLLKYFTLNKTLGFGYMYAHLAI